jgi:uncharacterized protein (DUF2336 family)
MDAERSIAEDILVVLARDVERSVRGALSEHLRHCAVLPDGLARTLAADVESVAVPFIRYSPALCDGDLVALVHGGAEARQCAVAERDTVSARVADALARRGSEKAVSVLLANAGADIAADSYGVMLDRFAAAEPIQRAMAARPRLPMTVVERLVRIVSEALRDRMVEAYGIPAPLADTLAAQGREGAVVQAVRHEPDAAEMTTLAERLNRFGQITPTLLLRSLCEGDLRFFEAALVALTELSQDDVRALLADENDGGQREILRMASVPEPLFRAFRIAHAMVRDTLADGDCVWCDQHIRALVRRLAQEYGDLCPGSLESVLSQVSSRLLNQRKVAPV